MTPARGRGSSGGARGDRVGLAVLLALVLVGWLPRLPPGGGTLDLRWDAGAYLVLGTSLAHGEGLRLRNEPGAPPGVQYPPALPLLVAAHQWVLGTSDPALVGSALRWTWLALSLAAAWATYRFARLFLAPSRATLAGALVVLHEQFVFQSNILGGELPFLACAAGFLALHERRLGPGRPPLPAGARAAAAGEALLAALAFLLRTAGVALLAAWVLEALLRRSGRALLVRALVAALVVGGWLAYTAAAQRSDAFRRPAYPWQHAAWQNYNVPYLPNALLVDPFAPEEGRVGALGLAARVARQLPRVTTEIPRVVSAPPTFWERRADPFAAWQRLLPPRPLVLAAVGAVGLAAVLGIALWLRAGRLLPALLVVTTLLLVASTPWPRQFRRYVFPIAPVVAVAALLPAERGLAHPRRGVRRAGGTLATFLACMAAAEALALGQVLAWFSDVSTFRSAAGVERPQYLFYHGAFWSEAEAAVDRLGAEAPPGAVVASGMPHLVHLRTGLSSIYVPFEPDPARARELLDAVPVEYVVVDRLGGLPDVSLRYGLSAVEGAWTLVEETATSAARVFRRP